MSRALAIQPQKPESASSKPMQGRVDGTAAESMHRRKLSTQQGILAQSVQRGHYMSSNLRPPYALHRHTQVHPHKTCMHIIHI